MISPEQIRAARAILDWSTADLAQLSGLTVNGLNKIERGLVTPHKATLEVLERLFEEKGIDFLDFDGVRRKPEGVDIFQGVKGFSKFHDTVYEHLKQNGGDVCVHGSSSQIFAKYRTNAEEHRARMKALVQERKDIDFRIIAREDDTCTPNTSYASYRFQPKEFFPSTAFYAFGDYLGLLSFDGDNPPYIVLIRSPIISESYRKSFNLLWQNAKKLQPSHKKKEGAQ